ncbi:MAG: hypothetical protein HPY94_03645 [Clostridia bacterium]|nr:hypothetical protein [Clostridia bacterium]
MYIILQTGRPFCGVPFLSNVTIGVDVSYMIALFHKLTASKIILSNPSSTADRSIVNGIVFAP